MWWVYEKLEDTHQKFIYQYSRESYELDGLIEYDKSTREIKVTKPCKADIESTWNVANAIVKFSSRVAAEGFPQTRKVAIG